MKVIDYNVRLWENYICYLSHGSSCACFSKCSEDIFKTLERTQSTRGLYSADFLEDDTKRLKDAPQSWRHEPNQMVSNTSKDVPSELFVNFLICATVSEVLIQV